MRRGTNLITRWERMSMSISRICRKTTFRFLKLLSLSISAVLGVFCNFGGCVYGPAPEYGMPHADYRISGTVLSSDLNLPIEGISVTIRDTLDASGAMDSTGTDSLGRYVLQFSEAPWRNTWRLKAEDTDSFENGTYISKDTVISIPESDLQDGSGSWYEGHGEKTVDFQLDRDI
jgi:putative lipoprotein (rSAM/lipoprotein system)